MTTLSLFRSEWMKIAGNRRSTALLMWVFPVVSLIIVVLTILMALLSEGYRMVLAASEPTPWTSAFMFWWEVFNSQFGRLVMLPFTAIVFAGEYQYGTWRNLIPLRRRSSLILNKFLVLGAFVVASFTATSLIFGFGAGVILQEIAGVNYGPPLTGPVLAEFAGDYTLQMAITFTITLISAGYTALAAIYTGNILASVLIGVMFNLVEYGILIPIAMARAWLDVDLTWLYQLTPGYNLANISSWVTQGGGFSMFETLPAFSLPLSLLVTALWIVGLMGGTVMLFRRQDITA
jgi:hypothetical protein